jgi:hypothetical protein
MVLAMTAKADTTIPPDNRPVFKTVQVTIIPSRWKLAEIIVTLGDSCTLDDGGGCEGKSHYLGQSAVTTIRNCCGEYFWTALLRLGEKQDGWGAPSASYLRIVAPLALDVGVVYHGSRSCIGYRIMGEWA